MSSKVKATKKEQVLSDSDSSDVKVTKKVVPTKTRTKSNASESSASVNLAKKKAPVKKQVDSDSESDKPVNKKPVKKVTKADSDSDESPKKPAKKVAPVKKAKDSDSDSDSSPKKPVKKAAPVKKAKDSDSDSDSSSVKPVKKGSVPQKKQDSDNENENEEGHTELFVKNLSWKADENMIRKHFSKFGNVSNVKVLTDKMTGKPRGIAFVNFEKHSQAQKAINGAGELDGRDLQCSFSNDKDGNKPNNNNFGGNRGGDRPQQSFSGEAFTIFVGNLGFKTNEQTIKKFFSSCGNVVSVRIAKQEDGRAKGFCHVDFDSSDAVEKACALAGQDLDGREVRVDKSEPRKPREGGFSRGGDRGGRGGRGGFGGRGGRGGFDRPSHGHMGGQGKKTTFDDSD